MCSVEQADVANDDFDDTSTFLSCVAFMRRICKLNLVRRQNF